MGDGRRLIWETIGRQREMSRYAAEYKSRIVFFYLALMVSCCSGQETMNFFLACNHFSNDNHCKPKTVI